FVTRPGSGGNAYTCTTTSSNSCGATSWYQRMRVADDDDGNLANGTPHAAALFAAFDRHALACGAAGDATNQSHTSCPVLAAPVLTRTSSPAGVELSWAPVPGATSYRVYRGELGCDRQQVPIATRTAAQTSYLDDSADAPLLRHYRVQAFASNGACASPVSACMGAPAGSRLTKTGHRVIDADDGIPEPGETFGLAATLHNGGGDAATSTTGTLSVVGPAHVRILDPQMGWPTIPSLGEAESVAPQPQLVLLPQAQCGQTLTLDLDGAASNSAPFSSRMEIPLGSSQRDYTRTAIVPIPFLTSTPVQANFDVTDDRTIADLDVTLDIFHQDPTQIIVELTSPQGTTVRLHDRGAGSGHGIETRFDRDTAPSGPGSMADFAGQSLLGTWTLSVQDVDGSGVTTDGYIRPRTLHATIVGGFGCTPQTCAEPTPSMAPDLAVARVEDGGPPDLVLTWSAVSGAGYHVLQSQDPRFLTGVNLIGNPATAAPLTVEDGAAGTPGLTFYQVRAVNSCHFEGP
ncbi:MAG TPA: proprotein convertase P-domain-containing protein, partial [Candidatus Polarisedimenticolaceae bacterium]|nr:proprotein convertase P-domain-containing protein [Candidatus Polarisedimenticolaceae bacterium]